MPYYNYSSTIINNKWSLCASQQYHCGLGYVDDMMWIESELPIFP